MTENKNPSNNESVEQKEKETRHQDIDPQRDPDKSEKRKEDKNPDDFE
ncbi:3-methyladenine DNA glycosylase [Fictibacillus enclensis]|nr:MULTISPECIES: 3-methyladenine DNA glycosylase [Fictibacillus]MDM5199164.1 3-methyladenine DNA glycosylase [Fictibacillus enclensis]MDM5338346.1 3-methyladenine DNA glycosylase [Fictibacillus enclensis]RXY99015.1 3-methyladenine DNA glycosylase [Fictibacillus sp. S7]SCB94919.1 hypothetical protein GA0061096_1551 [Fictibacillus enclensis]